MAFGILPVIDLLDGQVVRGVAGRRETYRPIESVLCASSAPAVVAAALAEAGCRQCYVADLNAIQGGPLAAADLQAIAAAGLRIWLDAGLGESPCDWPPAAAEAVAVAVAAAETAPDRQALQRQAEHWGDRAAFSLDMLDGVAMGAWQSTPPLELADAAVECGFKRMIVLDLRQVGMGAGVPTVDLCRQIRRRHPSLELLAGGGVRNAADLQQLEQAGCDAALVASALHRGDIAAGAWW